MVVGLAAPHCDPKFPNMMAVCKRAGLIARGCTSASDFLTRDFR